MHYDTPGDEDCKYVGRWARELVVPGERKLDGDAEAFDGHYAHRAHKGTDGNVHGGVRAAILRDDEVNHHKGEDENSEAVKQEAWGRLVFEYMVSRKD